MSVPTASERAEIAAKVGITDAYLYQCLTGRRNMRPQEAPNIERASEGRYPVERLRPDIRWHRVTDPAWPWHPAGRPLIDVARQLAPSTPAEAQHAA